MSVTNGVVKDHRITFSELTCPAATPSNIFEKQALHRAASFAVECKPISKNGYAERQINPFSQGSRGSYNFQCASLNGSLDASPDGMREACIVVSHTALQSILERLEILKPVINQVGDSSNYGAGEVQQG